MALGRVLSVLLCALFLLSCGTWAPNTAAPSPSDAGLDATFPSDAADAATLAPAPEASLPDAGPAELTSLATSLGVLTPAFSPTTLEYSVAVHDSWNLDPFTITATAAGTDAVLTVEGVAVSSGSPSAPIALAPNDEKTLRIAVKSGPRAQTYSLRVSSTPAYAFVQASNVNAWFTELGSNVALSGDTLVAGAPSENSKATGINGDATDTSMPEAGAAYVLRRTGSTWAHEAYIKASNTAQNARFGASIALSGDTLVVGAPGDADGGAAYVFTRIGATWTQEAYLKPSVTRASMGFGSSVALVGDTLVVGAPGESSGVVGDPSDTSSPNAGAAYVFVRSGTTWTQEAYLKGSNTQRGSGSHPPAWPPHGPRPDAGVPTNPVFSFGQSLALSGDTLVVGCPGEKSHATGVNGDAKDLSLENAGAVYVFTRSAGAWSQEAYIKASNTSSNSDFGVSVSISGDTVAVGAHGESDGIANGSISLAIGAVYVFTRAGSTWAQEALLRASNPSRNASFGLRTAIAGNLLAVGAIGESSNATGINGDQSDTSADSAGAVYVFTRSAGAWTQSAYVKAPDTHKSGVFGSSLALSGDLLAVGAADGMSTPRINGVYIVQ